MCVASVVLVVVVVVVAVVVVVGGVAVVVAVVVVVDGQSPLPGWQFGTSWRAGHCFASASLGCLVIVMVRSAPVSQLAVQSLITCSQTALSSGRGGRGGSCGRSGDCASRSRCRVRGRGDCVRGGGWRRCCGCGRCIN